MISYRPEAPVEVRVVERIRRRRPRVSPTAPPTRTT